MSTLILWLAGLTVGKSTLNVIDGINERIKGYRTELIVILEIFAWLLEHANVIPASVAHPLLAGLAVLVPMAERVGRILDKVDSVLPPPTSSTS